VITKIPKYKVWQLFCLQDGIAAVLIAKLTSKTTATPFNYLLFVIASCANECNIAFR